MTITIITTLPKVFENRLHHHFDGRPTHGLYEQSFNCICQVVPICMHNSLNPPHKVSKRQLDQFSQFCTDDDTFSIYITLHHPIPPNKIASLGGSWPPSNTLYLMPSQPTILTGISIKSAIFPQYMLITNGQTDGLIKWWLNSTSNNRLFMLPICARLSNKKSQSDLEWSHNTAKYPLVTMGPQHYPLPMDRSRNPTTCFITGSIWPTIPNHIHMTIGRIHCIESAASGLTMITTTSIIFIEQSSRQKPLKEFTQFIWWSRLNPKWLPTLRPSQ